MTACIIGWAHTPFGRLETETVESLIVRAATAAMEDAGIAPGEVDEILLGHFNAGFSPQDNDARSGNVAFVDGVAQINREERRGADITDAGESSFERFARVYDRIEGVIEGRVFETEDRVVAIGARAQVRVAIDQARKHRVVGEIDDGCAQRGLRSGRNALDAVAFDGDDNVFPDLIGGGIEEASGEDVCGSRSGGQI